MSKVRGRGRKALMQQILDRRSDDPEVFSPSNDGVLNVTHNKVIKVGSSNWCSVQSAQAYMVAGKDDGMDTIEWVLQINQINASDRSGMVCCFFFFVKNILFIFYKQK